MLASILRRATGRNYLMSFLRLGRIPTGELFTGRKAILYLRTLPMASYTNQLMYADIRMLRGMIESKGAYEDLKPGDFPAVKHVVPMPDARSTKYDYVFQGKYHDFETGTDRDGFFTIRSQNSLSNETLDDTAWEMFSGTTTADGIEWDMLELVDVKEYTKHGRG